MRGIAPTPPPPWGIKRRQASYGPAPASVNVDLGLERAFAWLERSYQERSMLI